MNKYVSVQLLRKYCITIIAVLVSIAAHAQAPSISTHPSSDTICVTGNKVFTVVASNTTSYQWQLSTNNGSSWSNVSNGGVYSGATTANLAITSATSGMNGYRYRVVCTGSTSPAATSSAAILHVYALPTVNSVTPDTICAGQTGQVAATASSGASITWHSASSGGTSLGSGSTYSASPGTTTTYYAQAEISYGGGSDTAQTPYNTNNGQRGAMFDVQTGSKAITVTHFDCSIYSGTTADYEIYYRAGTHVGFENNSAAWTYLGGASNVTSAGNNVPTLLPIYFSVTIPANTRYSFYITNDFGGGTSYTDGTAVGNVLGGNSDVILYEGVGKSYPFGLTFTVRNINCTMHYTTGNGCVSAVRSGAAINVNTPANITSNPSNSSIASGNNTSFSISATGATGYQWQVSTNSGSTWSNVSNGGIYSNATTATLGLTNATSTYNSYQYRCIATAAGDCNDTSAVATLTITGIAPSIVTHPSSATRCEGTNIVFAISANDATGYQWQVSTNGGSTWSNLSNSSIYTGTTSNTFTILGVQNSFNNNQYRCVVTGTATPNDTSNAATLTVIEAPAITTQPVNRIICTGANTIFGIAATGAGLTYQWEVSTNSGSTWSNVSNGGIYSNATTAILSITGATVTQNGYQYRCVVTGTCSPTATSTARTLTVNVAPAITTNPGNQTVTVNGNTSFTIAASNATSYQWQVSTNSGSTWSNVTNGGVYSNATTTTLTITSAPLSMNGYQYRCVATGSCSPDATSTAATLTVSGSAPSISSHPSDSTVCSGAVSLTFSVVASGTGLTYQWQENSGSGWSNMTNGLRVGGAQNSTLSLFSPLDSWSGNQYRCVVNGSISPPDTSNPATLTINLPPAITTQAVNRIICTGTNTTFGIVATGAGLTYQWQVSTNNGSTWSNVSNGGIYSNATTATLSITGATVTQYGYQYRCVVTGTCSPAATSTARTLTVNVAPAITTNPGNQTVTVNGNTSFTIAASNATSYQWQVSTNSGSTWSNVSNGGVYSNATTTTLNITSAPLSMNGYQYRCVATGICSPDATSTAATLTVSGSAPSISSHPANSTICSGANTSFSITASGTSLTYQWQVSTNGGSTWSNLSNTGIYSTVTTSTLNLTGATTTQNSYQYRCVVTGSVSPAATSNAATLTINTAPAITTSPGNSTVCETTNTTFTVVATGAGLTYQWQVSTNGGSTWSNLSNAGVYSNVTTATLSLTSVTASMNTYQYRCVVSGTCTPSATSGVATLIVNTAPVITTQPSNSTICSGDNTSFSVTATGTSLLYQWQVSTNSGGTWSNLSNTGIYSNTTTATLNLTAATTAVDGYQYRCVVSGTCSPSETSLERTLNINTAPAITTQPINTNVCPGGNALFTVVATGAGLTYQWQVSTNSGSTWSNLSNTGIYSNTTTATLNITGATVAQNSYQYRCVINGTCTPNETSSAASLSINSNLSISTQPSNSTICSGSNTSFSVVASGTGLTYQWQVSTNSGATWSNLSNTGIYSNTTTATLNLTGATTTQNGYQYRCVISSTCTAPANSNVATLTIDTAPAVTTQPVNSTICSGDNTSFTIAAVGTGLSYQWQVDNGSGFANLSNGGIYSGATTNTLNLTAATTTVNTYQYRCIVTGTCTPSATSNAATLTINTAPVITTQPSNSTICDGTNTTFGVSATGSGLTYQWQVSTNAGATWSNLTNGGIYSSVNTATLNITGATSTQNNYQFRCIVSGTCTPSATSNAATLSINSLLVITTQPGNSTICSGNNTSFSVVAGGSGLTYQWQVSSNGGSTWSNITNGGIYSNATTSTLDLTGATSAQNSYQYRCVISSTCTAPSNSNAGTLTVNVAPAITTQPSNSTICEGANTSFTIAASGAGITYQWEVNSGAGWSNVTNTGIYSGATTTTLNLTAPSAGTSSNQYRCVIGGSCIPGVTSNVVTLTVNTAPVITTQPGNSTICSGSNTTFGIVATGTALSYQWQVSTNSGATWNNVTNTGIYSGATTNTLDLTAATTSVNGNQYRCQVTGTCTPNVTSAVVNLTVNTAPAITTQPGNSTICLGDNTSFSTVATGTAITYQWQVNNGSGWNNVINSSIYTGSTSGTLSLMAAPVAYNGNQYRCVIGGSCVPGVTSNIVSLTVNTAPNITTQASPSVICEGNNTSFSIAATGTALTYQWQLSSNSGATWSNVTNTGIYAGATTNTLSLTAATIAVNNYEYRCVVSGVCTPVVTSAAVALTVNTAPTINTQPSNSIICENTNTSFSIAANGTGITYQWEVNDGSGWMNVSNTGIYAGATTNTLTLTAATTAVHNYQYRCSVSGTCVPGITSNVATLTINTAPVVTTQPSNSTICSGNNTAFSIAATGTMLTYQWQVNTGSGWANVTNGGIYSNATTNTLNLTAATTAQNGYQYRCVVNGICAPNTMSNAVTITVNALPAISSQPSASTICEDGNTSFSIVATGTGLTYQWQVSSNAGSTWTNLSNTGIYSGTSANALVLTAATTAVHNYQYRCIVGGTCTPAVISNAVAITILTKPVVTTPPSNKTICEGLNHSFSVVATGTAINYQWQVNTGSGFVNITNGGVYSNATTATLSLTGIPSSYTGNQYRCIVTGTCAPAATSASATLTVNTNPVVTAQPVDRTICSGDNTTFSVSATGTGLTYQWWVYNGSSWSAITNGGIYSNATTATLNVNGASAPTTSISYQYYCHVSGTCATANSDTGTLTIDAKPNVTSNPTSLAVCESTSNINFTIAATGTNLTYRWQVNFGTIWSNVNNINGITGATTSQLTIPTALVTMDGSKYRCVVYGKCSPNDTSSEATLTVYPLKTPVVTITASNDDICVGTPVTFNSSITNGGSTPGYQWLINGNVVGTNSSYTSSTLADMDTVVCVMTSSYVCPSPLRDTSNKVGMKVTPYSNPTITIDGAEGNLGCLGRAVDFTATTTHAGPTPTFVWQVNGTQVGTNADTFRSFTIQNGDVVNCIFTSSIKCPSPKTQTSNDMVMDMIAVTKASILIMAGPDTNVCENALVTMRTAYSNGGTTPRYQWVLNNQDIPGATQGSLKINSLSNLDYLQCRFISSARCVFPELSDPIQFTTMKDVKPEVDVTVYSMGDNKYMFKALPVNGGANPKYQWFNNGKTIGGATDSVYMGENMQRWERITVEMYSSIECVTDRAVRSRNITTGIASETHRSAEISVYPNPNNGTFMVDLPDYIKGGEVSFRDITGKVISRKNFLPNAQLKFNMKDVADGVYIIEIKNSNEIYKTRVVIRR